MQCNLVVGSKGLNVKRQERRARLNKIQDLR